MQEGAVATATPGIVRGHQVDVVPALEVHQVIERPHRIGGESAVRTQELGGDHRHVPGDTGHTRPVASDGADGARHVCPVVVLDTVINGVVVVIEIPAVDVVDIAVVVVVDHVAGHLDRIHPDVQRQIGVGDLNALVDHPDHHGGRARHACGPGCLGAATVLVGGAARAESRRAVGAVHAPQRTDGVVGVVRRGP